MFLKMKSLKGKWMSDRYLKETKRSASHSFSNTYRPRFHSFYKAVSVPQALRSWSYCLWRRASAHGLWANLQRRDHEQPVGQEECYQRFNFFSENAGFFLVATGLTSRSCDRFQERMKRSDAWSWGPWGQEDVFVHEWKAAAKKRIIWKNSSFSMN